MKMLPWSWHLQLILKGTELFQTFPQKPKLANLLVAEQKQTGDQQSQLVSSSGNHDYITF